MRTCERVRLWSEARYIYSSAENLMDNYGLLDRNLRWDFTVELISQQRTGRYFLDHGNEKLDRMIYEFL